MTASPPRSAAIIGSGIGGLASACLLARNGWSVTILEKNEQFGGRVGSFSVKGFKFDTGPSWFLMMDIFERFFESFGEDINDHLELVRLTPAFRTFFADGSRSDMHADRQQDAKTFDRLEYGSGARLQDYLNSMDYQYNLATDKFMYKSYDRRRDFFTPRMLSEGFKLGALSNLDRVVEKRFNSPHLRQILEFASLFLGVRPSNTPALYGILNHALLTQGVYYPMGGMYGLVKALVGIGEKHGAVFRLNTEAKKIIVENGSVKGILTKTGEHIKADIVVSNADIYHTEHHLLAERHRTKSKAYWQKAAIAPSALLLYLGVKGKLTQLSHHNLIFNKDWEHNFEDIFEQNTAWPTDPSIYICKPSQTDPSVAPKDHENVFALVPVPAGIEYSPIELDRFADQILSFVAARLAIKDLSKRIVYQKTYCVKDFARQFNSYRGSALGLAHTLKQTAFFRPNNVSSKVKNLYFVGAGTNPGIGIPPALISAELLIKRLDSTPIERP